MEIYRFRNTEDDNQYPLTVGDKTLYIDLYRFNELKTYYEGYRNALSKTQYVESLELEDVFKKAFQKDAKAYCNFKKIEVLDFLLMTNKPRMGITRWNQNFAMGQIRETKIVGDRLRIKVHVLRTRIYKNYSDRNEFSALAGAGMLSKVGEDHKNQLLSVALGKTIIDDSAVVPFSFIPDGTPEHVVDNMYEDKLTIKELKEFIDKFSISPEIAEALFIELDVHSPIFGKLAFAVTSSAQIASAFVEQQVLPTGEYDGSGLPEAFEAGNAIDPNVELWHDNLKVVEIYEKNNKRAKIVVYQDRPTQDNGADEGSTEA